MRKGKQNKDQKEIHITTRKQKHKNVNYQNLGNLNFPHFFVVCISVKKYGKLQIDRLTETKKVRKIQITQILIVSITISYIFCALVVFKKDFGKACLSNATLSKAICRNVCILNGLDTSYFCRSLVAH